MGDVISWARTTPLWSLLHSTIVLYDSSGGEQYLLGLCDNEKTYISINFDNKSLFI